MWNFKNFTVVSVMPLVSILKDQVEELSYLGHKVLAIGAGDKGGFSEGSTSVSVS